MRNGAGARRGLPNGSAAGPDPLRFRGGLGAGDRDYLSSFSAATLALARASDTLWSPYIALPSSLLSCSSICGQTLLVCTLLMPHFMASAKPFSSGLAVSRSGESRRGVVVGSRVLFGAE